MCETNPKAAIAACTVYSMLRAFRVFSKCALVRQSVDSALPPPEPYLNRMHITIYIYIYIYTYSNGDCALHLTRFLSGPL